MTDQMRTNPRSHFPMLLAFLFVVLLVSSLGGAVTATGVDDWYRELAKPPFNPPDWLFGPVWTVLYLAIGVAGWRLWRVLGWVRGRGVLALWGLQLVMNLCWSVIFFGLQAPAAALVWIGLLFLVLLACIRQFAPVDRWAAILFVPYALWVAFAAVLNGAIWWLN
ncbi:TspO/MBR family protein [Alkalilimnicola ehrlichii]|uniref:TspO/MBR family protein n=1 Tax=Alkalilimnicola ehrlichii TaxID=351052 RepID=UPI003BA3D951